MMPDESNQLLERLAQIADLDKLDEWLDASNPALGGSSPNELIRIGETDPLWELIFRIESGTPV